jgi:hypothetical protein
MVRQKLVGLIAVVFCLSIGLVQINKCLAQEKELTPSELIAKHVASIGTPEARARVKSRGLVGAASVIFRQGATGTLTNGAFLLVSEGQKVGMKMEFKDLKYPGEQFAYNGKETAVGNISPGQKSPLEDFVFRFNNIMKEGLLGGEMSMAWPLLNFKEGQHEVVYRKEKLGEKSFHVLEYGSNKTMGDVKVRLFFDPATYHHIRTEYRVRHKQDLTSSSSVNPSAGQVMPAGSSSLGSGAGGPGGRSSTATMAETAPRDTIHSDEPDSIYQLVEKFGGFSKVDGLTLPQTYAMEYSAEGHGASFVAEWTAVVSKLANSDKALEDQKYFSIQK